MDDPVAQKKNIYEHPHDCSLLNKQFIIMSSGTAVRRNSEKFRTFNVAV